MQFLMSHPRTKLALRILLIWLAVPYVLTFVYFIVPPPSTLMLADWVTGQRVQRHWVPLSQLPPSFVQTVLTAEDSAFCEHFGMDFTQLAKSIRQSQKSNKPVKATSTITQQTAKNLFFWGGRSWLRKFLEVPAAFWLEIFWSKERILETYLNIAQWGDGIYGVEAAARAHFGVAARSLTPYQSALLATSLPNPISRSAARPGPTQQQLASQLLGRTQKNGADLSCIR